MKTGKGLVEWARSCVHDGIHRYCYGTYCNRFTASKYREKRKQYPSHYTDDRHETYLQYIRDGVIGTDCVGLIKGYLWEYEGEIKYNRDGIPDVSAKGMYKACKVTGKIADGIPAIDGVLVFNSALSHVGVYDGKGNVLEARSFKYSMQDSPLSKRSSFTLWGLCPYIKYDDSSLRDAPSTQRPEAPKVENKGEEVTGVPEVKNKDTGLAVKILQRLLIAHGYSLPKYGVDGECGSETLGMLKAFQRSKGLTADGICGPKTWAALTAI